MVELIKRYSSDFFKYFYLGCDENDVDSLVFYVNGDFGVIFEIENIDYLVVGIELEDVLRGLYDDFWNILRDLYDDVDDVLKGLYNGDIFGSLYGDDIGDFLGGLYDDDVESIGYIDFDIKVKGIRIFCFILFLIYSSLNKSFI